MKTWTCVRGSGGVGRWVIGACIWGATCVCACAVVVVVRGVVGVAHVI